ncbi:translesion error-prone DNA polymerase V autoproteolytic subunit [Candidatus Methylospira mobilis]|uniref:LexA family protein n=1 Tax=Candidatus Methylospira mobilis TaxID=1808979 RepID=UPI0028E37AD5|nr:translesion error-prone DNA polymerase V autoproteolytic subunit [Candidatus Methylospira mobilis]WNV05748.1 translesion error-prone DNA polymerase V autoproteolytic subunit [Candidatus Methylospira mobilis]
MKDSIPRQRSPGAGRKPGAGPFGEATTAVRVPNSQLDRVRGFLEQSKRAASSCSIVRISAEFGKIGRAAERPALLPLPLFLNRISAGFPSPADDYVEDRIDLNEQLIRNKAATFFLRVQGESMTGAGINPGDTLIVDRSLAPASGTVVIAVLDGELTVKRLWFDQSGVVELRAENPRFPPIPVGEYQQLEIWGVVTSVIHKLLP